VAGSPVSGIASVAAGWTGDSVKIAAGCVAAPPQAASKRAAIARSSMEVRIISSQVLGLKNHTILRNWSLFGLPGG
jgi:hypothetical protein